MKPTNSSEGANPENMEVQNLESKPLKRNSPENVEVESHEPKLLKRDKDDKMESEEGTNPEDVGSEVNKSKSSENHDKETQDANMGKIAQNLKHLIKDLLGEITPSEQAENFIDKINTLIREDNPLEIEKLLLSSEFNNPEVLRFILSNLTNLIKWAAQKDYIKIVKIALDLECPIGKTLQKADISFNNNYLLAFAVENNKTELLSLLLDKKYHGRVDVSVFNNALIEKAVKRNDINLVKILLEVKDGVVFSKRVDISSNNYQILKEIISFGNIEMLKFLLEVKNYEGKYIYKIVSVFHDLIIQAITMGRINMVKYLLEAQYAPNRYMLTYYLNTNERCTELVKLAIEKNYPDVAKTLLESNFRACPVINLNTIFNEAVDLSIRYQNIAMIKYLFDLKLNDGTYRFNQNEFYLRIVNVVSASIDMEFLKYILEAKDHTGAYRLDSDVYYETSIENVVASSDDLEMTQYLLEAKDDKGNYRLTNNAVFSKLIENAIYEEHVEIIELFVNMRDSSGNRRIKLLEQGKILDFINTALEQEDIKILHLLLEVNNYKKENTDIASELNNIFKSNFRDQLDNDRFNNLENYYKEGLNMEEEARAFLRLKYDDGTHIIDVDSQLIKIVVEEHNSRYVNAMVLLLAYTKDEIARDSCRTKMIEAFELNENSYIIFLNNLKSLLEKRELNDISVEVIIDFAVNLSNKNILFEDKHMKDLLKLHGQFGFYECAFVERNLISQEKKESNSDSKVSTDIARLKLTSKDTLKAIMTNNGGWLGIFPQEIFNIILSFMTGYQTLMNERKLLKLFNLNGEDRIFVGEFGAKEIRKAREKKIQLLIGNSPSHF